MPREASTATPARVVKTRAAKKSTAAKKAPAAKRKTPARRSAATASDAVTDAALLQLHARLDTLEEKLCREVAALAAEVDKLQAAAQHTPEASETQLGETLQQHIETQLEPLGALLRRIDERVGFIGNRVKSSGGGPGRNKSWRRDQAGNARPRSQNGQRQNQPQDQPWAPSSAESVKARYAPRPTSLDHLAVEDE